MLLSNLRWYADLATWPWFKARSEYIALGLWIAGRIVQKMAMALAEQRAEDLVALTAKAAGGLVCAQTIFIEGRYAR